MGGLIVLLVIVGLAMITADSAYAKKLQLEGKVVGVDWVSSNHQMPEFSILDKSGDKVMISHRTIALNKSSVKIGDLIIKKNGSDFFLINGKKVRFAD